MKLSIGAAMRIKSSIRVLWICVCMSILTRSESKNTQSVSSISEDTSTSPNKVKIYDKEHIRKNIFLDRDQSPYASFMNSTIRETHVVWADFVLLPKDDNHTEEQLLDLNISKTLRLCQRQTVTELSEKLNGAEFEWCKWSLNEDEGGGKVKIGEHYGILSKAEQSRFSTLGCRNVVNNKSFSCDDERGDNLIREWRNNKVNWLCENNAESKLNCFDSRLGPRYCEFENVLMDFKRMRVKVRADGTPSRSWEKGFLSASCGEMGREDIGYFQVYKPDIEGSSDAVCDYVFNETVVAYSHDNIRSFSHMFSDFLNVQSLLWLSNTSTHSKGATFLNIDSFRMQPFFGDQPNEYFSHYKNIFKRIVRAIDFGSKKVCFKHLIMQSKPKILFTMDGWRHDLRCANIGPSSLYQRWNLKIRKDRGLLIPDAIHTQNVFTILLIRRASRIGSRVRTSSSKVSKIIPITITTTMPVDRDSTPDNSPSALGISNSEEITTMLGIMLKDVAAKNENKGLRFEIIQQDFDSLSFDEQVLLVGMSSLIVGMHGTGIALSMHMPVGTKYCCGVIEVFPFIREKDNRGTLDSPHATVSSTLKNTKGHSNMAKRMGLKYTRVDLQGQGQGQGQGRSKGTHPDLEPDILGPIGTNTSSTRLKSPKVIRTLRDSNGVVDRKQAHTGIHLLAPPHTHTQSKGVHIPFESLSMSVSTMIASILSEGSCLLPAVVLEAL